MNKTMTSSGQQPNGRFFLHLRPGTAVEALFEDFLKPQNNAFYDGTIRAEIQNGVYALDFADGDEDECCPEWKLRPINVVQFGLLPAGCDVRARWDKDNLYYDAKVIRASSSTSTYDVQFNDDHQIAKGVPVSHMRYSSAFSKLDDVYVGMIVLVQWSLTVFAPGRIMAKNSEDNTVHVQNLDYETEHCTLPQITRVYGYVPLHTLGEPDTTCSGCMKDGDAASLIVCDWCKKAYHVQCAPSPVSTTTPYYCTSCEHIDKSWPRRQKMLPLQSIYHTTYMLPYQEDPSVRAPINMPTRTTKGARKTRARVHNKPNSFVGKPPPRPPNMETKAGKRTSAEHLPDNGSNEPKRPRLQTGVLLTTNEAALMAQRKVVLGNNVNVEASHLHGSAVWRVERVTAGPTTPLYHMIDTLPVFRHMSSFRSNQSPIGLCLANSEGHMWSEDIKTVQPHRMLPYRNCSFTRQLPKIVSGSHTSSLSIMDQLITLIKFGDWSALYKVYTRGSYKKKQGAESGEKGKDGSGSAPPSKGNTYDNTTGQDTNGQDSADNSGNSSGGVGGGGDERGGGKKDGDMGKKHDKNRKKSKKEEEDEHDEETKTTKKGRKGLPAKRARDDEGELEDTPSLKKSKGKASKKSIQKAPIKPRKAAQKKPTSAGGTIMSAFLKVKQKQGPKTEDLTDEGIDQGTKKEKEKAQVNNELTNVETFDSQKQPDEHTLYKDTTMEKEASTVEETNTENIDAIDNNDKMQRIEVGKIATEKRATKANPRKKKEVASTEISDDGPQRGCRKAAAAAIEKTYSAYLESDKEPEEEGGKKKKRRQEHAESDSDDFKNGEAAISSEGDTEGEEEEKDNNTGERKIGGRQRGDKDEVLLELPSAKKRTRAPATADKKKESFSVKCAFEGCNNKEFTVRSVFSRHIRDFHMKPRHYKGKKVFCPWPDCDCGLGSLAAIQYHVWSIHHMDQVVRSRYRSSSHGARADMDMKAGLVFQELQPVEAALPDDTTEDVEEDMSVLPSDIDYDAKARIYDQLPYTPDLPNLIFSQWVPLKKDCQQVPDCDWGQYMPVAEESPLFRQHGADKPIHRLPRFQALGVSDWSVWATSSFKSEAPPEKGDFILNVGGPLWAAEWCPGQGRQYMALGVYREMEETHPIGISHVGPGLIQLWDCGALDNNPTEPQDVPRLALGIAHNYGHVTCLSWCPGGARQEETETSLVDGAYPCLGLLAACFGDGMLRIFAVPHPSAVAPTQSGPVIVSLKPLTVLKQEGTMLWRCHWSPLHQASSLAVSTTHGCVLVWNLASIAEDPAEATYPVHEIAVSNSPIMQVVWCPTDVNLLAASDLTGHLHFYDLRDPGQAVRSVTCTRGWITRITWEYGTPGIMMGDDDGRVRQYHLRVKDTSSTGAVRCAVHDGIVWDLCPIATKSSLLSCDEGGLVRWCYMPRLLEKIFRNGRPEVGLFREYLEEREEGKVHVFQDYPLVAYHKGEIARAESLSSVGKNAAQVTDFAPLGASINRITLNHNKGHHDWLVFGGASGLIRLRWIGDLKAGRPVIPDNVPQPKAAASKKKGKK